MQLEGTEAFGIAKLTTKGNIRIVENLTYHPIDKEMVFEERTLVDYLHRQVGDGLYKIWPKDPLAPGGICNRAVYGWQGRHRVVRLRHQGEIASWR